MSDSTTGVYKAQAPIRICDIGGWTDIKIARRGAVLNFAVSYYAKVRVEVNSGHEIVLRARDFGSEIRLKRGEISYEGEHQLLKAALKVMNLPSGLVVDIYADVPPGCGTGTSAAISVALLGALMCASGQIPLPAKVAALAHRLETEELGYESGVQDQYASAYGGVAHLLIPEYPRVVYSPVRLPSEVICELEHRLFFVDSGMGHKSSDVHKQVIAQVLANPFTLETMEELAALVEPAANALYSAELDAFGQIVREAGELQKSFHPQISTPEIARIEEVALAHGAAACKINGAGGGGTVSVLAKEGCRKPIMEALKNQGFESYPIKIDFMGLQTWQL